jgi:splicing factor 3A subunit 3
VDYLTYLSCFHDVSAIPEDAKLKSPDYQRYLQELKGYLLDFYRKTQPLVDLDDVIAETQAKFDKNWALNEVLGWDTRTTTQSNENGANGGKPAVESLFCTACDRQFTSEGVYTSHLTGKKHKKAVAASTAPATENGSSKGTPATSKRRQLIAFDEVLIRRLYELLTEVIHGTISYLEVKQTRTHEELQAEIAEEEEGAFSDVDVDGLGLGDDNDDEDQPIYNPLNLPLGWDGKPIPYWLYKLHGLGVEFKCEICGNHSYWGRRDFDRHFQQWRHAHGMRCLGVPNTKHFHDITLINDAMACTFLVSCWRF